jgi:two-component system sensor histidine kinase ChiS
MDNQLTEGVFTPERVDILKALSSQVAISIENANYIKQMQLLNHSYNRFVPNEFLRLLGRESILEVNTGDHEIKEMIILFADIRNFTTICETIPANETFSILNSYLTKVTPAIHINGGTIDKFMGDGIMALFPNDVNKAIQAAVDMQRNLVDYNNQRELNKELAIQIGVGLHIGDVILGTVGTENRMSTTVIGDPVNLSARLESYTKTNKANVLLSEEMVAKLEKSHSFHLRSVGSISVKGKKNKVKIFEEYSGVSSEVFELIDANKDAFEYAVVQFEKEMYAAANTSFQNYLAMVPADKVAHYFQSECLHILNKK